MKYPELLKQLRFILERLKDGTMTSIYSRYTIEVLEGLISALEKEGITK